MRPVSPFRYMAWAKDRIVHPATYNLAASGLAPPPAGMLSLDALRTDLEHRGRHMPPVLRARMSERLGVSEDELMLTLGTSHAMYLLCASQLSVGDLCFVERPAYEMLCALPTLFGANVERFDRDLERGWRLPADLADTIRERRPRIVLLSNPHNPTGALLSREELEPVVRAATEVGAIVAVDEVYLEFLDDPMAASAFGMSREVAVASSLTKAYGLGTVRLGWLCADVAVTRAALTYNDYISVLYPNPSAWVGMAALDALPALRQRAMDVARTHRAIVERWIDGRDDVRWHVPEVGIVGFVELSKVDDVATFVERLRADHDTLVVPGHFFEAPGFVRLGFGVDREVLEEGLVRLGRALG